MAVIKIEALKFLIAGIVCEIPELEGHTCIGQAPPNHSLGFPSLAVVPVGKWRFHPDQDGDDVLNEDGTVFQPLPDRAVVRIGRHEVLLQLQLACDTQEQRYELEQKVEAIFNSIELHPGIYFGKVKACAEDVGEFTAAFMLEDSEWEDGKAFQNQAWSFIEVQATIPVLATRRGRYAITEIQLGLTELFDTEFTSETFSSSDDVERRKLNADGTISPA